MFKRGIENYLSVLFILAEMRRLTLSDTPYAFESRSHCNFNYTADFDFRERATDVRAREKGRLTIM